jgi:hypothetical protein
MVNWGSNMSGVGRTIGLPCPEGTGN